MIPHIRQYRKTARLAERYHVMLDGSEAYLTWAMKSENDSPRIPIRSGSEGGYGEMIHRPGARAAANHYWARTLSI